MEMLGMMRLQWEGASFYEELNVSLSGEVTKKATKISLDKLVDLEPTYYVDLNQDGYIGNVLSYDIIA